MVTFSKYKDSGVCFQGGNPNHRVGLIPRTDDLIDDYRIDADTLRHFHIVFLEENVQRDTNKSLVRELQTLATYIRETAGQDFFWIWWGFLGSISSGSRLRGGGGQVVGTNNDIRLGIQPAQSKPYWISAPEGCHVDIDTHEEYAALLLRQNATNDCPVLKYKGKSLCLGNSNNVGVMIPLMGEDAGCLLISEVTASGADLAGIGLSINAAFRNNSVSRRRNLAMSPFADHKGVTLTLQGRLEVHADTDWDRTYILLRSEHAIETSFRTTIGNPLLLRPIHNGPFPARMVFADWARPETTGPFLPDQSLLLDGEFEIVIPELEYSLPSYGVVCGLSEREYIPLESGDRLVFKAGKAAHYGSEPVRERTSHTAISVQPDSDESSPDVQVVTPTDHVPTSWIGVINRTLGQLGTTMKSPPYRTRVVSEDAEFSLLAWKGRVEKDGDSDVAGTVLHHAPESLQLKGSDFTEGGLLPIHPWVGLRSDIDADSAFLIEQLRLQAFRRSLLELQVAEQAFPAGSLAAADVATRYTPMGLKVEVFGGRITKVILGRSSDSEGRAADDIALSQIPEALSDALMRADLFLIADTFNRVSYSPTLGVKIRGWGFDAEWPAASNSAPVLLVKGAKGSIESLLSRRESWARKESFVSDEDSVAERVREALSSDERIFKDRNWTGVLIIGAKLDAGDLPDGITGLMAGNKGDSSSIEAKFLGVEVNRVDIGQELKPSPLFGLIDYQNNDEPAFEDSNDFAFMLGKLEVRFENAEVRDFTAKLKLGIKALFDGVVCGGKADTSGLVSSFRKDAVIEIDGRYEKREANGRAIDVYTFRSESAYVFDFNKDPNNCANERNPPGLLRDVKIRSLTFQTVAVESENDSAGSELKTVRCRFAADGNLRFNEWPESAPIFGNMDNDWIGFVGLGIDLVFQLKPFRLQRFELAPANLSLDLSKLNPGGIFESLPLRFDRFHWSTKGFKLPDLGFMSLKAGRIQDGDDDGRFGLSFDLDLGSLGQLSELLSKIKFKFFLGFGFDRHAGRNLPKFSLGFKLENTGGGPLDIGIGNVLRIRAKAYDLLSVGSNNDKYYFIYAVDAKLVLLGRTMPNEGKLNLFVFVDPRTNQAAIATLPPGQSPEEAAETLVRQFEGGRGGNGQSASAMPTGDTPKSDLTVGWFAVLTQTGNADGGFSLEMIALGQKVDPFPEGTSGSSVRQLVDQVSNNLGAGLDDLNDPEKAPEKLTELLKQKIRFAPTRDWTIALRAEVESLIGLDLLIRDPDLYGLNLKVADGFEFDVMYRKLSAELGVYSVEVPPPSAFRRIDSGAMTISFPSLRVDVYTDGGFNADIGFPANRDFSRSFAVEMLPYTGAGGFYLGRLNGLGAKLIPGLKDRDRYDYHPVVQFGIGFRLGFGKSLDAGPFRAGLSLTLYAYLEGAQGSLRVRGHGGSPAMKPAQTYRAVSGAIGIMGEIYGYVDFGIVKASVAIILYAEAGVVIRTDDYIVLHFAAGVSVRVSVVVARIKIFRKRIEIRVSFSYATRIRFKTQTGKRRERFDEIYDVGSKSLPTGWVATRATQRRAVGWDMGKAENAPWTCRWALDAGLGANSSCNALARLGFAQDKVVIPLLFMPDVTAAPEWDDTKCKKKWQPHVVFTLFLDDTFDDENGQTAVERYVDLLSRWLLVSSLGDLRAASDEKSLLDWELDSACASLLSARVCGADTQRGTSKQLPTYEQIVGLLSQVAEVSITVPDDDDERTIRAAVFPMPEEIELTRSWDTKSETTDLSRRKLLTEVLEEEIKAHFDNLKVFFDERESSPNIASQSNGKSVAGVIFEQHVGYLLRGVAAEIGRAVEANTNANLLTVRNLLELIANREPGSQSLSQQIAAAAGRFLQYGLVFPRLEWNTIKNDIPGDLAKLYENDDGFSLPLYRFASLQLPMADLKSVALLAANPASWFSVVNAQMDAGPLLDFARAVDRLESVGDGLKYHCELLDRTEERIKRAWSVVAPKQLGQSGGTSWLFGLPDELIRDSVGEEVELVLRDTSEDAIFGPQESATLEFEYAIAMELQVEQAMRANKQPDHKSLEPVPGVYQISGADEQQRRLLDTLFESPRKGESIQSVVLFVETGSGEYKEVGGGAMMIQTSLAVDVQPGSGKSVEVQAASHQFSAWADREPAYFIDLIRRAAIVNSGGFWLQCNGDELKPGSTSGGDGAEAVRLLMLVILQKAQSPRRFANTLYSTVAGQPDSAAEKRLATFDDLYEAGTTAAVIRCGWEVTGGLPPGTLPLRVSVPNPALGYATMEPGGVLRSTTFEKFHEATQAEPDPLAELLTRFNLLEYSFGDKGHFAPIHAWDLLPVGDTAPDHSADKSAASQDEPPKRINFDFILPLWRYELSEHEQDCSKLGREESNPYEVVGKDLDLRFLMRDIYGNSLPGEPKQAEEGKAAGTIKVPYFDRLIDLSQLPGVSLEWLVTQDKSITIAFEAAFDVDLRGAWTRATGDAVSDSEWATILKQGPTSENSGGLGPLRAAISDTAKAAIERFRLALWQVADGNVTLELESTLIGDGATNQEDPYQPAPEGKCEVNKEALLVWLKSAHDRWNELADETSGNEPASGWKVLTDLVQPECRRIECKILSASTSWFIETKVNLILRRPFNLTGKRFPNEVRTPFAPAYLKCGQGAIAQFAASIESKLLGNHYLAASGAPAKPGVQGEALWFVRKSLLPLTETQQQKTDPVLFAVPPLATRPVSVVLESVAKWVSGSERSSENHALTDIDADAYAKSALDRIEVILTPELVGQLVKTNEGRSLVDTAMAVKQEVARRFAECARALLKRPVGEPQQFAETIRNRLADRFRSSLRNVYGLDAVLAYPVGWAEEPPSMPGESLSSKERLRPLVFGALGFERINPAPPAKGMLPTGSLPLPSEGTAGVLTAFYDSSDNQREHQLSIGATGCGEFSIHHIQRLPRQALERTDSLPVDERYRETQWLELLQPYVIRQFNKSVAVPIPRRSLPDRPQLLKQSYSPTGSLGLTASQFSQQGIAQQRKWQITTEWNWQGESSDELEIEVQYQTFDDSPQKMLLRNGTDASLIESLIRFDLSADSVWAELAESVGPEVIAFLNDAFMGLKNGLQEPATLATDLPGYARDCIRVYQTDTGDAWEAQKCSPNGHGIKGKAIHHSSGSGWVKLGDIDIMRYPKARTGLSVFRNRTFTIGEAATQFIYRLDGIFAGDWLSPWLQHEGLLEIDESSGTLAKAVANILSAVFTEKGANGDVVQLGMNAKFDLDVSYLPQTLSVGPLPDGKPTVGEQVLPGMVVRRFVGLERRPDILLDDQAIRIARELCEWFELYPVSPIPEDARLRFSVTVYRSDVPVLRLGRIEVKLKGQLAESLKQCGP